MPLHLDIEGLVKYCKEPITDMILPGKTGFVTGSMDLAKSKGAKSPEVINVGSLMGPMKPNEPDVACGVVTATGARGPAIRGVR